jgi:uncharacterized repeat protein (TIGR03803 family)
MRCKRAEYSPVVVFLTFVLCLVSLREAYGQSLNIVYEFGVAGTTDGMYPYCKPVFDTNGNLYGTTQMGGGSHNAGIIFELSPTTGGGTWAETIIHEFTGGSDGGNPMAGLIFASGNLYGTASYGGANGTGVVFELSPKTSGGWTYRVLYNFGAYPTSADGFGPNSALVLRNHNLYGTTSEGGVAGCFEGCGTVFELLPTTTGTWKERLIHEFPGGSTDGELPGGALIFDTDGNLYGTTQNGGGTANSGVLYRLKYSSTTKTWIETVVHNFVGGNDDGSFPEDDILIHDSAGNLYGTTEGGGINSQGTVFKASFSTGPNWTVSLLHSFGPAYSGDGTGAKGGVIKDTKGNFYGTTFYGGAYNYYGAAFKLSPTLGGDYKESVLHNFTGGLDGFYPNRALTLHAGWLYGTATNGGSNGTGVVYQLKP